MSLDSGKTLGGVGAILIAVGSFVPFLGLVGLILVLVAMKRLSEYYNERSIFNNALYGFILGIISIVVAVFQLVWVIARVFVTIQQTGYYWDFSTTVFEELLGVMTLVGVITSIFALVQAIFYRKSLTILSKMSGEKSFVTAGLLLLIGTIVSVVIGGLALLFVVFEGFEVLLPFSPVSLIGGILPLVAWILAAVGFFNIKPLNQTAAPTRVAPTPEGPKFCQYCGAQLQVDAVFCQKCGKKTG